MQSKTYTDVTTCDTRVQVHQGGTRSGKTYSIVLCLIEWCWRHKDSGAVISVVRKTFPSLRATVMRDFIGVLEAEGVYSEANHNRGTQQYNLFGNLVEFLSVDQSQKIRGRKRDIVFMNEANELSFEDYQQLIMRTSYKIILDYNPSMEYHWIFDKVITRDDCSFFKTTYLDNPFLEPELVAEIERLKDIDPWYWKVYGLGERGASPDIIFRTDQYTVLPEHAKLLAYGLDWGFSVDPTSFVGVWVLDDNLYIEEFIYQTGLTNREIGNLLKDLNLPQHTEIVADSAEPKSIEELHRMGFNLKPSRKGSDSVRVSIDFMRRYKIFVKDDSLNAIKEFRNYRWKTDKNGKQLNIPVDAFDHCVDAARYVCINKLFKKTGKYLVS
jgi:phage terminase large subunit